MNPIQGKMQQAVPISSGSEPAIPEMEVHVSSDRLTAFLTAKAAQPDQVLTYQNVIDFLAGKGITYGICEDAIRDFCDGKNYSLEIPCAKALAPVDEDDAEMQYLFKTDCSGVPVEREDGTVDFRDLGLVQNVKKGDVLCQVIPPAQGRDGMDVFGKPIPYQKGRTPAFPSGSNTLVSKDGLELAAAIDGCIEYKNNTLNVNAVFIVHGNVDSSSGNIIFLGNVIVQGDVMEGFTVKAGGDITVRGMVEGAVLEADGNISITNGVNGMHGGKLTAGGNIRAKYFQNAELCCEGDVFADVIMNSNVKAGHSVVLHGSKARIMGGRCCAGRRICANDIGTENYVRTDVCLDSRELNSLLAGNAAKAEEISALNQKVAEQQQKQQVLKKQIDTVSRTIMAGNHSGKLKLLFQALAQQDRQSKQEVEECKNRISELEQSPVGSTVDFNIIGLKAVYSGTKITIGSYTMLLANDYNNTKFYVQQDQIVSGPVLPSDRMDF